VNKASVTNWLAGTLGIGVLLFVLAPMMHDKPAVLWPMAGFVVVLISSLWVWGHTSYGQKGRKTEMLSIGIMVGGILIYSFGALAESKGPYSIDSARQRSTDSALPNLRGSPGVMI
jgi:hypothetical protein